MKNYKLQYDDKRFEYVKKYGKTSLAYSSLQDFMQYYLISGIGYVPYSLVGLIFKTPIGLSDPICDERGLPKLLEDFTKEYPDAIFFQLFRPAAEVLNNLGFYVNEFGTETIIDVQNFNLTGKKKQNLRSAINNSKREGIRVEELPITDKNLEKILSISEKWRKRKISSDEEFTFLARPAVYEDEPDVRKFYALKNNDLIGFVYFDPMYKDNKIIGYAANILRSEYFTSGGICDYIILSAIEKFKLEGIKVLSLDLSPFNDVNDKGDLRFSRLTRNYFQYSFENLNHIFNFKGLAFHKERYRPDVEGCWNEKVYFASKSKFPIYGIYKAYRRTGINPILQTVKLIVSTRKRNFLKMLKDIPDIFLKK